MTTPGPRLLGILPLGILGSLDCHRAEKLVIAAESIPSALRLLGEMVGLE